MLHYQLNKVNINYNAHVYTLYFDKYTSKNNDVKNLNQGKYIVTAKDEKKYR